MVECRKYKLYQLLLQLSSHDTRDTLVGVLSGILPGKFLKWSATKYIYNLVDVSHWAPLIGGLCSRSHVYTQVRTSIGVPDCGKFSCPTALPKAAVGCCLRIRRGLSGLFCTRDCVLGVSL